MGIYIIANENIRDELLKDLEGRLEVWKEDGLEGSNDYEDADEVFDQLEAMKQFPASLELNDAQTVQLFYTVEGVIDFSPIVEVNEHRLYLNALYEKLEADGYATRPGSKEDNIFNLYRRIMGVEPQDATLKELPTDSECGKDCRGAIMAAGTLLRYARLAVGDREDLEIRHIAEHVIEVFWRG